MRQVFSLVCLLASANLDTMLLGISWTLSGRRLSPGAGLVIGLATSGVTALSLTAGNGMACWIPSWLLNWVSGLLLMGMGAWSVLDWLREKGNAQPPRQTEPPIGGRQTLVLALTLGVNNCGIGLGAGLAGCSPWLAGGVNLLLTWGMLLLGALCAGWMRSAGAERWVAPGSGVLLIVIGALAARGG